MRRIKSKHSKIRNTGLLYEFLLRQVTADVLDNDKKSTAISILKKRFHENTFLGKELALYNIIINKKFKSDKKAEYFINEVLKERNRISNSELKREKYNLIKSLKETYDLNKFLSSKVNNYKTYASIYKLFEYASNLSPDEKTEAHFNLIEYVTTEDKNIKLSETVGGTTIPKDQDLRILTYRTLLEKFNQKYSKLNLPQKSLLRAYINNVSGTNSLYEFIEKIKPALKSEIKKYSKNVQDDVVKIKLKEAINSLDKFCSAGKSKMIKDNVVVQTMRYLELLKELKKSGNKKQKVL
tara:strand:- start:8 stop:895 length:888 start_codon:yes stop_codon:yes gene_type:complete